MCCKLVPPPYTLEILFFVCLWNFAVEDIETIFIFQWCQWWTRFSKSSRRGHHIWSFACLLKHGSCQLVTYVDMRLNFVCDQWSVSNRNVSLSGPLPLQIRSWNQNMSRSSLKVRTEIMNSEATRNVEIQISHTTPSRRNLFTRWSCEDSV